MPTIAHALLLAALLIATSVWLGGYVALVVVARVATSTLAPMDRVAFFRRLGRAYLWVGSPALVIALVLAAVLARDLPRGPLLIASVAVAALIVLTLAIAVAQARRMTRLRARAGAAGADGAAVAKGARQAAALRAVIGVLTLVLITQAAFLAT